jgi:hypothetical protein
MLQLVVSHTSPRNPSINLLICDLSNLDATLMAIADAFIMTIARGVPLRRFSWTAIIP